MSKENNIKEKFKIALISTEKAISDDYAIKKSKNQKNLKDLNYFEIDSLNTEKNLLNIELKVILGHYLRNFLKKKFLIQTTQKTTLVSHYMNFQKKSDVNYLVQRY